MKRLLTKVFVILSLILPMTVYAVDSITWNKYGSQAYIEASKTNAKIMIFAMSETCPYCAAMKRDTFSDPVVIKLIATNFYPIMVHADIDKATSHKFHLRQVPTIIFLKHDGSVENIYPGYQDSQQMLKILSDEIN